MCRVVQVSTSMTLIQLLVWHVLWADIKILMVNRIVKIVRRVNLRGQQAYHCVQVALLDLSQEVMD